MKNENASLKEEIKALKIDIIETERKKKLDTDKFKKSFDEMDYLLGKEKEVHKMEEEKLLAIVTELEEKLKITEDVLIEKQKGEKFYAEEITVTKEAKRKLLGDLDAGKKRELEFEVLYKKSRGTISELQANNRELTEFAEKTATENTNLKKMMEEEKDKVIIISITNRRSINFSKITNNSMNP